MPSLDVLIVDAGGVLLMAWLFNLVRRGRLYVGYGAIFVLVIAAGLTTLSVPPLLRWVNQIGAVMTAASGLGVLALLFVLVMLIYIMGQLSQLSNRLTSLIQELAIRRTTEIGPSRAPDDGRSDEAANRESGGDARA